MFKKRILRIVVAGLLIAGIAHAAEQIKKVPVHAEIVSSTLAPVEPGSARGILPQGLMVVSLDQVLLLSMPDGSVLTRTSLDEPVSYAAAAVTSEGLVLAGGVRGGVVSDRVTSLVPDASGILIRDLPALPVPLAMASSIVMDGALFVIGGTESVDVMMVSANSYSLDLANISAGWKNEGAIPGGGRLEPGLGVLSSELYVFGGWAQGIDGWNPLKETWAFRVKPLDGTTHVGWRAVKDMPRPLAAPTVYATGQAHFALLGGYADSLTYGVDGLPSVPGDGVDSISIYSTVTDTWIPGGALPAPAGRGIIVPQDNGAILVAAGAPLTHVEVNRTVRKFGAMDYGVLVLYFAAMAGVGVFFARRQKSSDEYALGNRGVKWWAAAISMFATGTSAISFMAIPALAFRTNLVWLAPLLVSPLVVALQAYVLFPLLRRLQITSTFEYLERRFHPSLRFLASIQCMVFHVFGRMSVVLLLPALAISAVSGASVETSVLIMGLIATFYTALGGFEAVIWTDVIQGALMLLGVLLMILLAVHGLPGGWGEFITTGQAFHRFDMAIWSFDVSKPVIWMYFVAVLVQGISVVSDQPTVQRVFSAPMKDVRRLATMSMACGVLVAVLITMAGMAVFAYFHAHPQQMDPAMRNDQVIPLFVVQGVPPGVAGVIIAGIFAASLSTLAGSMNSVATLVGEDFYRRISRKATDRKRLVIMKTTSVCVGVFGTGLAYVIAGMKIDSIFQIWNEVIALFGGGFVGIYCLGIFSRRTSSVGAVVGALGSIVCTVLVKNYTSLHWVFYTPFAMAACMLIGYGASWVIPSRRSKNLIGLTVFDPAPAASEPVK